MQLGSEVRQGMGKWKDVMVVVIIINSIISIIIHTNITGRMPGEGITVNLIAIIIIAMLGLNILQDIIGVVEVRGLEGAGM